MTTEIDLKKDIMLQILQCIDVGAGLKKLLWNWLWGKICPEMSVNNNPFGWMVSKCVILVKS